MPLPAAAELASRIALAWMNNRPFSAEAKARRKENRRIRKAVRQARREAEARGEEMPDQVTVTLQDGTQVKRTEPIIPARTSTKVAVVGGAGGYGVLEALQSIDWPGDAFDNFLMTQAAAWVVTLAVSYIAARWSRSPTVPPTVL